MDLALELGMTLEQLKRTMRVSELRLWARYADQRKLPTQRLEYALARVAQVQAQVVAGSDSPLGDFMVRFIDPNQKPDKKAPPPPKGSGAAAIGFVAKRGVIKLGQRR